MYMYTVKNKVVYERSSRVPDSAVCFFTVHIFVVVLCGLGAMYDCGNALGVMRGIGNPLS